MVLHPTGPDTDLGAMEHRHLTVMMVDLVGSTVLAQTLDPEDLLSTTLYYQKLVEHAAEAFGGSVLQIVGDGVLVVFGWPSSSENNAERAMRSALRIHSDLAALSGPVELKCRIGIASGVVLVGDIALGSNVQPDAIFGSTLNLAARLQSLAEPGGTLVSAATRALGAEQLAFHALGAQSLAGFDRPVPVYRLAGEAQDKMRRNDPTPLIGRGVERGQLRSAWSDAEAEKGRVIYLQGEAGIGKSHLIRDLRASVGPQAWVIYHCSPFHVNTPFFPFTSQIERWCGIQDRDDVATRRDRLSEHLSDILDDGQLSTLFFVLAPGPGDSGPASEEELHANLVIIFRRVCEELSREGAVLVVVEDLQWADPSTLSILQDVAEQLTNLPVLFLVAARCPVPQAMENSIPSLEVVTLPPLDDETAAALVGAASDAQLDDETVARIVSRGNGIPLFIKECAAVMAASPGRTVGSIPASLHDLLAQQIDDVGDLRRAAVEAAVIGNTFSAPLVAHVSDISEAEAKDAINQLVATGILQHLPGMGGSTDEVWCFRHELVREAAYQSLVRDRRALLHRRAATALETQPEAARQPEQIARHWELAGAIERAVAAWIEAARLNLRRHANQEGTQHAKNGLRLLGKLPAERRDKAELALQFLLAAAERVRIGYGAEPAIKAFDRSFELARKLGDRRTLVRAGRGLFTAAMVKGDYHTAEQWGQAMIDAYEDHHTRMVGNYVCGSALAPRGQFPAAAAALDRAASHAEAHAAEAGNSPDVAAMLQIESMGALVDSFQGNTERALARAKSAVDAAGALGQTLTLANAMHWQAEIHMQIDHRDYPQLAERLEKIVRDDLGPYYKAVATAHLAGAAIRTGDAAKGVALLQSAWDNMHATGAEAAGVLVNTELARGFLDLGDTPQGLKAIKAGLNCAERMDERNYEAELHRIRAALLVKQDGASGAAEAAYRKAAEVARNQGAILYEKRALNDLVGIRPFDTEIAERLAELDADGVSA
ncbi:AAA family ATPase [uncultured Ruegeria sp.]|uniref:ATP-binding protein n=1 Tax=uncultured Ruegeria sp. TaxID=259304 RepID=UPI0026170D38|nr:adenylate/guanylate cyclase domain-containing protein [uncultured Ruegeria sp.]